MLLHSSHMHRDRLSEYSSRSSSLHAICASTPLPPWLKGTNEQQPKSHEMGVCIQEPNQALYKSIRAKHLQAALSTTYSYLSRIHIWLVLKGATWSETAWHLSQERARFCCHRVLDMSYTSCCGNVQPIATLALGRETEGLLPPRI